MLSRAQEPSAERDQDPRSAASSKPAEITLIDDLLPAWDFAERHEILVRAPATDVFAALRRVDLARGPIVRTLFWLRGMGRRAAGPARHERSRERPLTLDALPGLGFVLLGEVPGREVALGIAGRFWTPTGDRQSLDARAFQSFNRPGFAKAVWDFSVSEDAGPTRTRLATETRILCLDATSRRRFRLYWTVVRPFSGLVRREILRTVRREAESIV